MLREWLDKWVDSHDLGGITVGEIKAEFAALELQFKNSDMALKICEEAAEKVPVVDLTGSATS